MFLLDYVKANPRYHWVGKYLVNILVCRVKSMYLSIYVRVYKYVSKNVELRDEN